MNDINQLKGLVGKDQLKDILSVYAAAINQNKSAIAGADVVARVARQLAVMYFLPSWSEGKVYGSDAVIRLNGRVFKSLTDGNTSCPYTVLTNEEGTVVVNENWEALILDDVNDDNWAQLEYDEIPVSSIPERQSVLEQRQALVEQDNETWKAEVEAHYQEIYEQRVQELKNQYTAALQSYQSALAQYQSEMQKFYTQRAEWAQRLSEFEQHTYITAE